MLCSLAISQSKTVSMIVDMCLQHIKDHMEKNTFYNVIPDKNTVEIKIAKLLLLAATYI